MGKDSEASSHKGGKGHFWVVASVVLLLVVGYNIYSGVTLKKLDVFGLFSAEFEAKKRMDNTVARNAVVPEPLPAPEPEPSLTPVPYDVPPGNDDMLQARIQQLEERVAAQASRSAVASTAMPPRAAAQPVPTVDLSGLWESDEGLEYQIIHTGNQVQFSELNPLLGVTASGTGTISNGQVTFTYVTALGTNGRAVLKVLPDGDEMEGEFVDLTTGGSSEIYLSR